jgi:hypothetical protein
MATSHGFDPRLLERVSQLATAVTAAQGRYKQLRPHAKPIEIPVGF